MVEMTPIGPDVAFERALDVLPRTPKSDKSRARAFASPEGIRGGQAGSGRSRLRRDFRRRLGSYGGTGCRTVRGCGGGSRLLTSAATAAGRPAFAILRSRLRKKLPPSRLALWRDKSARRAGAASRGARRNSTDSKQFKPVKTD